MFSEKRIDDRITQELQNPEVDGRYRRFFWPTLRNAEDAKKAVKAGAGMSLFIAGMTAAFA